MNGTITVYLDNEWFEKYDSRFTRYSKSKDSSKNKVILDIMKNYLDDNQRYLDTKITSFEVEKAEEHRREEPEVVCKECGALRSDIDSKGFVIHDKGCSWNRNVIREIGSVGEVLKQETNQN